MIKSIDEMNDGPMEIDLTGPQGNAYALMGLAAQLAKVYDKDKDAIVADMMSGDYEHLLEVFEREFGEHVILYR